MIQANELRLNNLMQDAKGRMCKVERLSLDPDEVQISAIKGGITSRPISPIPLTREIIHKSPEFSISAFDSNKYYLRDHDSQFHLHYNEAIGRFVFRGLGMSVVYVDTLHHLQNLVYVNTGKELEVKL